MASKDDSDKENLFKGKISDRTRSKSSQPLTPKRRKQLASLDKIRTYHETGQRPKRLVAFERDVFKSIEEEDYKKRELEERNCIVDDIGDDAFLSDGKGIVDNCERGKGNEAHSKQFTLTWLKETQVYMCYGCGIPFREKPKGRRKHVPQAPRDIVLMRKQTRKFRDPHTKELTASKKPECCYYHISSDCILKKNPKFKIEEVCISKSEWSKKLASSHKDVLEKEFGIRDFTCNEDY